MSTIQAIGFANKFYTLWSIDTTPRYTTDSYGKHWLTGYDVKNNYIKNISMDLEKAKSLYPTLEVMEDLKGKTNSWSYQTQEDLCPQIMKFGKYLGHNIDELLETDFNYVIWICENRGGTPNGKYSLQTEKVVKHYQDIEDAKNQRVDNFTKTFAELVAKGSHEFVAERNLGINDGVAYTTDEVNGLIVTFLFKEYKEMYYQGHTYALPLSSLLKRGENERVSPTKSGVRIKGKTIRVEFTEMEKTDERYEFYTVVVNNITIL